jgi:outer membrane protein assembly factor BamB
MLLLKSKAGSIAFSAVLMVTIAISLVALPASAQVVGSTESYTFIGATPNPVGVGQEVLLHIGITQQLQITQDGWEGLTVTVTYPDDHTTTLGPYRTDATGSTGDIFVPNEEGTYMLQTHFPGQWYNASNRNLFYEAADSVVLELIVTSEAVPIYPGVPLPSEYWTRPIDAQAQEWSVISGNWLGISQTFAGYLAGFSSDEVERNDDAPETAHILWNQNMVAGGLAGGNMENHAYHMGDAYEGFFSGSVIIDGKLFYNKFNSIGGGSVDNYVVAVDIHTGETLWTRELLTPDGDRRSVSFGQVMYWDSFNVHGVFAYLWGTSGSRWDAFDPVDGRWLFAFENVPGGSTVVGPKGELIRYQLNVGGGYMTMWNSTAVIDAYWGTTPNSPVWGSWRPQGKVIDATGSCPVTPSTPLGFNGYQWNVSIPTDLTGSVAYYEALDYVVGYYRDTYGFGGEALNNPPFTVWSIDLTPGNEGNLKFKKTYDVPAGNVTIGYTRYGTGDNRVFIIRIKELFTMYGYSLDSGNYLWGPTEPEYYLSYLETWTVIDNGKAYTHGTKGIIDCYDITNGEKLWSYAVEDPNNQILWSNNWNVRIDFIVDDKIYCRHSEHSPVDPMPRGAPMVCLNATTGEVIWRADGLFRGSDWGGHAKIADSIITTLDTYDMRIYGIGKGPSATSVSASPKVSVEGSSVLVEGMVTDISPGTEEYALTARFPDGVPAVSDENMSEWMLYVYKQFERPKDVNGVDVTVSVLDPNGNYYDVGTTKSDDSGFYKLTFTPPVPGEYKVISAFSGSKAYYGSFAETAIQVETAPPSTPAPTAEPESIADLYLIPSTIGIIVAIVVVGLLVIFMLRRQ